MPIVANEQRWTGPFLDEMRNEGDPLADDAVAQLFANNSMSEVRELLRHLSDTINRCPRVFPGSARVPSSFERAACVG